MIFKTVVPILYSRDVATSLAYYTGILGVTGQWSVGDPPSFAGINKDSVEVFFCREGQGSPGTGKPIGSAQLLGDNNGFFYVKDVNVNPEWQGRGVGTALMQALSDWLDKNAPGKASVWLHTAEQLKPFYKQFGFIPVPGMARFFNSPGTSS